MYYKRKDQRVIPRRENTAIIMKEEFILTSKVIGDFYFRRSFLQGDELTYSITFLEKEKPTTFRMKRDESGQWKIQAQALPTWILDSEMRLSYILDENEQAE